MKKQQKFFRNPSVSFAASIPQFAMAVPLRSQVRLRLSRLSVQHGRSASSHRPALTLARCSVAAHCASLRVLATSAFGPPMFASSLAMLPASLGSSTAIAPQFAMGRPAAPYGLQYSRLSVQHGRSASSHRPALTLARCSVAAHCASLRVLATSALRASDVRMLTRGASCFTGLIGGYCTLKFAMVVLLRPTACSTPTSQFSMVASLRSQSSLEMLPASLGSSAAVAATGCAPLSPSLGLLRPVSRTARGLRAPHWLRRLFRPHWAYFALLRPQGARFVRPLAQGSLLVSGTIAGSSTVQKPPVMPPLF